MTEMTKDRSKYWMDWYYNHGGREKVLSRRKSMGWMNKKKYEEAVKNKT